MFDKAGIPRKEIFDATNARNRDIHTPHYRINSDTTDVSLDESGNSKNLFDLDREGYENELIEYYDFMKLVKKYMEQGHNEEAARTLASTDLGYDM